jgi:hypothetical protein
MHRLFPEYGVYGLAVELSQLLQFRHPNAALALLNGDKRSAHNIDRGSCIGLPYACLVSGELEAFTELAWVHLL